MGTDGSGSLTLRARPAMYAPATGAAGFVAIFAIVAEVRSASLGYSMASVPGEVAAIVFIFVLAAMVFPFLRLRADGEGLVWSALLTRPVKVTWSRVEAFWLVRERYERFPNTPNASIAFVLTGRRDPIYIGIRSFRPAEVGHLLDHIRAHIGHLEREKPGSKPSPAPPGQA